MKTKVSVFRNITATAARMVQGCLAEQALSGECLRSLPQRRPLLARARGDPVPGLP